MWDADDFQISIDEEGICRVIGHEGEHMVFTVTDFGRFLTAFLDAVVKDRNGEEEIDLDMDDFR